MASLLYNSFKRDIMNGSIDMDTDTLKLALLTNAYTANVDTHDNFDDVSGSEVSGTGYTAGGTALTSKAVTVDTTDDEGVFDADDVTWSTSTITARYAVLYKDTGTPSTSKLIALYDFGSDKVSSAGNFTFQANAEGYINLN
jgi:hypothetical protein